MAPLQPLVLTVSVHNCQLVLLRRFVNDVLFVAALINHEGTAFRSCKGQHQVMSSSAAPQSPPSVMILSLRNVQVGLLALHKPSPGAEQIDSLIACLLMCMPSSSVWQLVLNPSQVASYVLTAGPFQRITIKRSERSTCPFLHTGNFAKEPCLQNISG